jgi:hypothetical protein
MTQELIVRGRYADRKFIAADPLPDAEGPAALIITPASSVAPTSMFDLFGKAARLRSAEDIAAQIARERKDWGEP